jgi:hypothetical protein
MIPMSNDNNYVRITELKNYFLSLTKEELQRKYESQMAKEIFRLFRERFNSLLKQYENNNDYLLSDAINPIFLIALDEAQALTVEELEEQMLTIYREMLQQILLTQKEILAASDDPWKSFVRSSKANNKQLYENEAFQCKTVIDEEDTFGFDIHRCVYHEIFLELAREDLAPILCQYDFLLAESVKEWVVFERKETIANGNKKCTFRYYKKK